MQQMSPAGGHFRMIHSVSPSHMLYDVDNAGPSEGYKETVLYAKLRAVTFLQNDWINCHNMLMKTLPND